MAFVDQELQCKDCGNPFPFAAGEAKFYQEKSLSIPKRCPPCRAAKKAKHAEKENHDFGGVRVDDLGMDGGPL